MQGSCSARCVPETPLRTICATELANEALESSQDLGRRAGTIRLMLAPRSRIL